MAEQSAAHARKECAEREHRKFLGHQVDAQRLRRNGIIAHGGQTAPIGRAHQSVHDEHAHHHHDVHHPDRGLLQTGEAAGTIGQLILVVHDGLHDHDQRQRRHGQIVALRAHHREGDHQGDQRRRQTAQDQRRREGQRQIGDPRGQTLAVGVQHIGIDRKEGGHVCADAHERRMAHGEHAGEAVDQVEACAQQGIDAHGDDQAGDVAVGLRRRRDQYDDGQDDEQQHAQHAAISEFDAFHQLRPPSLPPKRPLGRNRSTTIISVNTKASR